MGGHKNVLTNQEAIHYIAIIAIGLALPVITGLFFGTKGLLFMINGSNAVCFCMSLFLINSGQAWDSARKFVLFGLLKDADGRAIGPESSQYENLGIGQQIGGPLEDATGPSLNNFIKFVTV